MSALDFGNSANRFYENGIEQVVLYVYDGTSSTSGTHGYAVGKAWNGVMSITESPQGADANPLYADDIKYLNLIANETFQGTIEAYSSPKEFDECDGLAAFGSSLAKIGQQVRKKFCLAYKTRVGTVDGDAKGVMNEKWHFVYNCKASPASKDYSTVNDSPEAATLSWEFNCTPLSATEAAIAGVAATYNNVCTVSVCYKDLAAAEAQRATYWANMEKYIIGDTNTNPQILFPGEIYKLVTTGQKS